ncbi:hypothetical protein [Nonomuraea sp. LPB2021202275-12-8]|uniref:hypothetical protein n=1 Tax=Nonomuraea sp. LPB2021202275-12-8 TaxID=3120159 RepID=UPI00300C5D2C
MGFGSRVYAQSNAFDGIPAEEVLTVLKGTAITAGDNLVNGAPTDLVAAHNAATGAGLGTDVG